MIASALACEPQLLIADKPTTALDVTTQAQIVQLVTGLSQKMGMAALWVTHDLALVRKFADRVIAFYVGRIVESGTAEAVRRRRFQIVLQDPFSTFSPRLTIGQSLEDALWREKKAGPRDRNRVVRELLGSVGLDGSYQDRYPHELSGGQCQRVAIARALSSKPDLLICDESVSALDVSIQAQIINLLQDIQGREGIAILFISHDLGVVRHISSRVAVMNMGRLVELGSRDSIFDAPRHPYTRALLASAQDSDQASDVIKGEVPDLSTAPSGCRFHPRCPLATPQCRVEQPAWREVAASHWANCHEI